MALVAYSDESDMSDCEEVDKNPSSNGISSIVDDENNEPSSNEELLRKTESVSTQSIFKLIPSVKTTKTNDIGEDIVDDVPTLETWKVKQNTVGNIAFDVKKNTVSKKVKITLPSLLNFEEEDESEQEPAKKKFKPSGIGTGLLSILPSPKVTEKRVNSFIPESLKRKIKQSSQPPKKVGKPIPSNSDAEDEDDDESSISTNSFFTFHDSEPIRHPLPSSSSKSSLTVDATPIIDQPISVPLNSVPEESIPDEDHLEIGPTPNPAQKLDETALLRLTGKRNNKEAIDIIDVHADDALLSREEWEAKALSEAKPSQSFSQKKEGMPSATQKRKHQITYLAHQAKAREQDLKNMWAQNRFTKKQTQGKYGF